MPVVALLVAEGLRSPPVVAVALAAAFALSVTGLARMDGSFRYETRTGHMRVPDDLGPLLDALDARGKRTAQADYWVAERITFESRERIVANSHRYPPFTERVAASADPARVFVAGTTAERRARPTLLAEGYDRVETGGFALYSR
jgi:hypothetical protein